MNLHPAVAFAAALIGGQLGGILAAFLALPVAAVIQASIQEYGRHYVVVENPLTGDVAQPPTSSPTEAGPSWWERVMTRVGRRSG
jgi:flagellar motor component MotA